MSREVVWLPGRVETFIHLAGLDELENQRFAQLMRMHARGYSSVQVCNELHISKSTYDRSIHQCKKLYDLVQEMHPQLLPPRDKKSAK